MVFEPTKTLEAASHSVSITMCHKLSIVVHEHFNQSIGSSIAPTKVGEMAEDDDLFEAIAHLFDGPNDVDATSDSMWMSLLANEEDGGQSDAPQASISMVASHPEKRRATSGHNWNKSRETRRQELLFLRKSVPQLEDVVAQLRQRHEKRSKSARGEDVKARRSVWAAIAARQLDERRKAEETNTQLRVLLANQTKLTRSLERIVMRPSAVEGFKECGVLVPRRSCGSSTHQCDPNLRQEMLQKVEANYNEVDALFERLHLQDEEQPSGHLQVRRDDKSGYLETYQLEILPVNVQVAGDLVWQHYAEHMSRVPFRQYYERTTMAGDVTEDTIIERIGVELLSGETVTATTRELQVMRRYTEENRVVIVWYCTMRPVTYSNQEVNPVDSLERGYMVFEPPKTLDPESHSVLKLCITQSRCDQGIEEDELQRKATECMFAHGVTMASTLHRSIENMLLERRKTHPFYKQKEQTKTESPVLGRLKMVRLSFRSCMPPATIIFAEGLRSSASVSQTRQTPLPKMTSDDEMFEAIARPFGEDTAAETTSDALLMRLLEDSDEGSHTEPMLASTAIGSATRASKKKARRPGYNPNQARDARRHELLQLQKTVQQLEGVAAQLRNRKSDEVAVNNDTVVRHSVWKSIAARQLEERRRAEETNMKLQILLADQTKLAKRLERMVMRPSTMQGYERCGLLKPRRSYVPPRHHYDPSVCTEMLHEVEENYNEIDALFERLQLQDAEESSGGLQIRRDDTRGRLESFLQEILPVNAQLAATLVWQNYAEHMSRAPFRQYYERTAQVDDVTEDTIVERVGVELHTSDTIMITSLQVMRRYTEEDRVVIVWYSTVRPGMLSGQNVTSMDFLERGYLVFETPKTLDPESHSVLKMCVTLCRSTDDISNDDEVQRKVSECMFIDGIAMASTLHRSIENMLMERAKSHSLVQDNQKESM
ncbi:hypothetical protein Poli38472_000504 [Pythium oligandrum]|uniref:M96 mating-specific protein family n=1 Tax=Pythium oligandrum TaxID=41045 RepID=A0A8K1CDW3_PYTOL|nr:hypothetical protein Poli38472_000504 [Pythium oligandrum]|eukprot:TMW60462.1 hypothetical protein Poli38472_000504 [Pythium oligandrum]